jgi:hypothetical protein
MWALTPHPSATESFEKFSQNERLRVLGDSKRNRLPVGVRDSQQIRTLATAIRTSLSVQSRFYQPADVK